jgi:glycosyltransferase involved in cell wall biosynthesis/predicted SAM-dependent methyltransferase
MTLVEKDIQIENLHDAVTNMDTIRMGGNILKIPRDFLIVSGIDGAPFIYRCHNLKEQLYNLGYHNVTCKYVHEIIPSVDVELYDLIILNRPYKSLNITELLELCKKKDKIVVYATDDLVTDHDIEVYLRLDKYMSISELKQFHNLIDWTKEIIKSCHAVIVSTEYLRSKILNFHEDVYVLENALSEKQIKAAERILPQSIKKKELKEGITLGYFSGWPNDHDYDFATIKEPMFKILDTYPNVRLRVVGYLELDDDFNAYMERIDQINFVPFDVLPNYIADVDINIAPLEPNPHKRAKSAIKFFEAAALKVPTVATNLEPYAVIEHGVDGMLCTTSEDWYLNIEALLLNPSLRFTMGEKARHSVRSKHTCYSRCGRLKDIIKDIANTKRKIQSTSNKINTFSSRLDIANYYIKGEGVEIGALNAPIQVNTNHATVQYIDRIPVKTLLDHYVELEPNTITHPDIVADAEDLSIIPDSSQDFIIANHLLEHLRNPIKALREFHRIAKKYNSVIFLALPNQKNKSSFDKKRNVTDIEHIVNDYYLKDSERETVDFEHFKEWAMSAGNMSNGEEILQEAKRLYEIDYSIHYHVFSKDSFLSLLDCMNKELYINFEILEKYFDEYEYVFVLKPIY